MATITQTLAMKDGLSIHVSPDSSTVKKDKFDWGGVYIYFTDADPNGTLKAPKGSLAIDIGTPTLHINTDAGTTWTSATFS